MKRSILRHDTILETWSYFVQLLQSVLTSRRPALTTSRHSLAIVHQTQGALVIWPSWKPMIYRPYRVSWTSHYTGYIDQFGVSTLYSLTQRAYSLLRVPRSRFVLIVIDRNNHKTAIGLLSSNMHRWLSADRTVIKATSSQSCRVARYSRKTTRCDG